MVCELNEMVYVNFLAKCLVHSNTQYVTYMTKNWKHSSSQLGIMEMMLKMQEGYKPRAEVTAVSSHYFL